MRNRLAIFLVPLILPCFALASGSSSIDPIYQLFDDESDRMAINQIPLELDPVSVGFDSVEQSRMKNILNPSFIQSALSAWVDQQVIAGLTGVNMGNALLTKNTPASDAPSLALLMDRSHNYQKANVTPVAREELAYALRLYPKSKDISQALGHLSSVEYQDHMKKAEAAHKAGDLSAALVQVNSALTVLPKDDEALDLKQKLLQEKKLSTEMAARVSGDYRTGVELYQSGKLDLALASFVRVLNFDPTNKAALDYIQKIGERMKVSSPLVAPPEAVQR